MTQVATLSNLLSFLLLSQSVNPVSPSTQLKLKTNLKNSDDDMAGDVHSKLSSGNKLSTVKLQQRNKRMSQGNDFGEDKAIELEMKFCRPYLSIVKVEVLGDHWGNIYFPSFVELYRCKGGCFVSPRLKQCTATQQDNLTILVTDITTKLDVKVLMSNHTACECGCAPRRCNARQHYDDEECICKCIKDGSHCKVKDNKRWNKKLCQCECYNRLICEFRETWNSDSCKCEPDDTIYARVL